MESVITFVVGLIAGMFGERTLKFIYFMIIGKWKHYSSIGEFGYNIAEMQFYDANPRVTILRLILKNDNFLQKIFSKYFDEKDALRKK